ncbi:hypothetical protein DH2020_021860 [Rehmannia glutinosa]|uniref:Uncharacterized protein n=1 Tax=Rehmannia glutinosa TaxID=99300 RepID=A0ABR0WD36_REHGL
MAGAGGGIVAQIITYPLQTVNTRQQTERVAKKEKDSIPSPASRPARSTLVHIFQVTFIDPRHGYFYFPVNFPCDQSTDCSRQVFKSEGLGGLYSGLKPSLLGTAASQAFKNKAEAIAVANKRKGKGDGSPGMLSWLIVAALAGSVNVLLTNPIWVLVTRMQTHTQAERKIVEAKKEALLKEASGNALLHSSLSGQLAALDSIEPRPYGTFQAACEVYNESGIAGFWKGIIPTLIMVCNPSIQFMIYESLLKRLRTKRSAVKQGPTNIKAMEIFLVGAVAKLGATISTYPLLVVKSRLQAKQEIGGNISLRYSGTIDAIIKMIRYEGLSSFYKGMSTKIVQSVFAASVLFMVKEELVKTYTDINLDWPHGLCTLISAYYREVVS